MQCTPVIDCSPVIDMYCTSVTAMTKSNYHDCEKYRETQQSNNKNKNKLR